jgi:hypothetical protein
MSTTVCFTAGTLFYPEGGGNLWLYLNWALSFRSIGCRVIWLEAVPEKTSAEKLATLVAGLKERLAPYGLDRSLALWQTNGEPMAPDKSNGCLDIEQAAQLADLLVNQYYAMPEVILRKFRRTALLDIDPGQVQMWAAKGLLNIRSHDCYFTIGEQVAPTFLNTLGRTVSWVHTPPCVSLEHWPVSPAASQAPFTTVTHWYSSWEEENGELYPNGKKDGFVPVLELPRHAPVPLELCVYLGANSQDERALLENFGWRVAESNEVTASADDYQRYIRQSLGEFSCAKPAYVRMQNAWVSDRTICYLASGKPVVLEDTGPSQLLTGESGYLRFRDLAGAAKALEQVAADYTRHSSCARALAEEYFDGRKVTTSLLQRVLN